MTLIDRCRDGLIMLAVAALSLGLLVYIGWSEGQQTYSRFQAEKMAAQGELVQTAMDAYLRAGLPVGQFPGFRLLAESIRQSDPTIAAIAVHDRTGQVVFADGDVAVPHLPGGSETDRFLVRGDGTWLQVALPLRNRFETVGELTITMPRHVIADSAAAHLPLILGLAAVLTMSFGLFAFWITPRVQNSRVPWIGGGYVLTFAIAAVAIVVSLLDLYADGAQSKAKALADSLARRIEPVVSYGLKIEDFEGLDQVLIRYRQLNPDIRAVGITLGGVVVVHSDQSMIGHPWQKAGNAHEYVVPVGGPARAAGKDEVAGDIRVVVSLPGEIVWRAVLRGIKNFGALFVASALIAGLFLGVARALESRNTGQMARQSALIRPIFFIAVFCENLTASFLPQLLRGAAAEWGLGQDTASLAFAGYFAAFLLILLPASGWIDRHGPRKAITSGALLVVLANLLPAMMPNFGMLLAARIIAGLAQGLLFIGVQAAVLASAPAGQRTRAAAIIVFGFNAGMIAGAAIGSLLVEDISMRGVFALSAAIACLLAIYAVYGVTVPSAGIGAVTSLRQLLRDIPHAVVNLGFLRALLLIGAPSKAILTGAVGFAMPLLLSGLGWEAEDIGQAIMLYAAGVLISSGPMARFVDYSGRIGATLVVGGVLSAAGLAIIGSISLWQMPPVTQAILVIGGIALVGLAHGCINAPVITYVGTTGAATRLGTNGATALYRMAERLGHLLGPIVVGQLLLLTKGDAIVLLWMGGVLLVCAVLFALPMRRQTTVSEDVR